MVDPRPGFEFTGVSTPFFCHDGKGRFLFHKRSQNCRDEIGRWDVGSGRLKFKEELTDSVLREIREEYGCAGTIDEALPPVSLIREHDGHTTHWIAHPFIVRIDPDQVQNGDPEKIEELGWFTLDSLPAPLHSATRLELVRDGAKLSQYAGGHNLVLPKE